MVSVTWFVLTVDMPGFETEDINVGQDRGQKKTYHRRFPKHVADDVDLDELAADHFVDAIEVSCRRQQFG